jgi:hypothetical protein
MALCETETKVSWKMTSYKLKSVKVGAYQHPMVRVYWTRTITCGVNDCEGPVIDGYGLTCALPKQGNDRYLDYILKTWRNPKLTRSEILLLKKCMEDQAWGPYGVTKPHETFQQCYENAGLTLGGIIDPSILTKEPNVSYKPCKCVYFKFMDQPDWILSSSEKFRRLKEDQTNEELFMKQNIASNRLTGAPQW